MKKKVLWIVALIAAIGVGHEMTRQNNQPMNLILSENVEALASGEISGRHHCYGSGSVDCPINHDKAEIVYSGYSLGNSLY